MTRISHAVYNLIEESVTFGAGIGLSDASTFLEENGRSLIHTPAWGIRTIVKHIKNRITLHLTRLCRQD